MIVSSDCGLITTIFPVKWVTQDLSEYFVLGHDSYILLKYLLKSIYPNASIIYAQIFQKESHTD